jgi:predicted nucleotidyltransferase
LLGVIFLSGLNDGVHSQIVDSITFTFIGQPADGDTVTISGHVFEFDNDGNTNYIPVIIGDTIADTISNFNTAVGGV